MVKRSIKNKKGSDGAVHDDGGLPVFDGKALSALTERIEKGLEKSQATQQQKEPANRSTRRAENERHGSINSKAMPITKMQARGTKRDSQGKVKVAGPANSRSHSSQTRTHDHGDDKSDRAVLLREILALGGDENDLDLVVDAVSDGEDGDLQIAMPADTSLRKDIARFVADLGIQGNLDDMSSSFEGDEGAEDDWAHENVSDSSAKAEASLKISKPALPDVPPLKNPNHLVSSPPVPAIGLTDPS